MDGPNAADPAPKSRRRPRRWVAILLSLVAPGRTSLTGFVGKHSVQTWVTVTE